ncbi:hypothetical protein ACFVSW_20210 [Neobacillus sp. NPDC058068]|uniref:hypothetical protein n=1 Tax=Neobacillus sp. NPDC058068 TaxID=3346325 RepID=UPI0036DBAE8D
MDAAFFWNMTYGEIVASITGFNKRQKTEFQMKSIVAYRQADLIASLVSNVLGSKHQPPSIQEAFPGIFPEIEQQPKQQNWQLMKARIEAYAAEKRAAEERKRGENRGDDSGGIASPNNV